ncbi:hypothetical protein SAMN04515620_13440 [Collimonas sp. OK607]|uniref:hypothetical protein n=1 Tax=Collimonas sp. OK607 TaxID=1798194 RepID=UPI0008EF643E|nr:hypothetical protein [Collimonas sp. OK607]SFB27902.1 hypothetical protein SAMN04515620_13440 [Collimonas sp. OK607]
MEKDKFAFKTGITYLWWLVWSPFVGAYEEMKAALYLPRPANWKELVVQDIRLYFAPFTGAITGFRKALKGLQKKGH